ncbi:transcriptional regulator [Pseudovibrio japonicus]|uniref:Transcriptional regulator n=1 Tax=Pseudovibrio japonicus TaxID=366534 RepID=A0ABQ3ELR8_9HYPH|nr:transcriptional regulator [Pseudovibrio japonicus]
MRLTAEGQIVASYAGEINQILDSLDQRLSDIRRNKEGTVRMGSFGPSASTRILPQLLRKFAKYYPNISVNIQESVDAEALLDLRNGIVDMAVLADPRDDFETLPLATDQLVALVPQNSPLSSAKSVGQSELLAEPFIMTLGGNEPNIIRWFGEKLSDLHVTQRVQQTHSILALVEAGLGNAIVAALSLPRSHHGVRPVPLKKAPSMNIVMARKTMQPRSNAAALFWNFWVEEVERGLVTETLAPA